MIKIITYIVFSIIQLISFFCYAHQKSANIFITNHMNLINPAFESLDDTFHPGNKINKEWPVVRFAPETRAISFETLLEKK